MPSYVIPLRNDGSGEPVTKLTSPEKIKIFHHNEMSFSWNLEHFPLYLWEWRQSCSGTTTDLQYLRWRPSGLESFPAGGSLFSISSTLQQTSNVIMSTVNQSAKMTTLRYDAHWRPYSLSCSVCMMPYNNIIHFEHLKHEESWIIKKLSADNILRHRYIYL